LENLLRKLGIVDTELYEQPLTAKAQATANTAGEKSLLMFHATNCYMALTLNVQKTQTAHWQATSQKWN
jgi:hypothetical protein